MPWQFTDDIETYAGHTEGLLAARPAENTVALTVLAAVRAGRRWSDEAMVFGWYVQEGHVGSADAVGGVSGAMSLTPPYELLLAVVPAHCTGELVDGLRARGTPVSGVNGEEGVASRFGALWTQGTALVVTPVMRTRLYALGDLRPPLPPPPGVARPAASDDLELAVRWVEEFQAEAGTHAFDVREVMAEWITAGLLWCWEDLRGSVVSLAGRNPTAAGVARVGPVFTPPEHRRRGFGAAVTSACTAAALEQDAQQVVLFTDQANPASNSIYQQIGFRPLSDRSVVRFDRQ